MKLLLLTTSLLLTGCIPEDPAGSCTREIQEKFDLAEGKVECMYNPVSNSKADLLCDHQPSGRHFICRAGSDATVALEQ